MAQTYTFRPATRVQAKLRMALGGPSNSGKTYTALLLAKYLGDRIALIDTERGSSQKYAGERDMPPFDVVSLEHFSTEHYIAAINAARAAAYPVLIIDSLSHAWQGVGGILEHAETITISSKSRNAYTEGWRKSTPLHNKLVDTMLQYPGHLLVTVRSKIARIQQEGGSVKIVGMEWVQRADLEYEFDLAGDLDKLNTLSIIKTRCSALNGAVFAKPGAELAKIIVDWLNEGAPSETPAQPIRPSAAHGDSARRQAGESAPPQGVPGVNGPHVDRTERQLAQAKQELILNIVSALKKKYPGEDKTSKQDRSDMARELFGVPGYADLKQLPLAALQQGYTRLTQPAPQSTVATNDEDLIDDVPEDSSQRLEAAGPQPDPAASSAAGTADPAGGPAAQGNSARPEAGESAPPQGVDDEQATEALLLQLERYADSQGMTPAWMAILRDYDAYRLDDGVLILTEAERFGLYAKAQGLWPDMTDTDVRVF